MDTSCASLSQICFFFSYEIYFMLSILHENQANIIEVFISTSQYLEALLRIDNGYFEQVVDTVYPKELYKCTPEHSFRMYIHTP